MTLSRSLALLTALSMATAPAAAGGKGTTAAPFLKIPVNARAVALGGSEDGWARSRTTVAPGMSGSRIEKAETS